MRRNVFVGNSLNQTRRFQDEQLGEMEELSVVGLSQRKESVAPTIAADHRINEGLSILREYPDFPLPFILRLRVLQIVCGISSMVIGVVAYLEERDELKMALGVPTGGLTIIAAAFSIHTTLNASTMSPPGGGISNLLWMAACSLQLTLIIQCCRTAVNASGRQNGETNADILSHPSPKDLVIIACIEIGLTIMTIASVIICLRQEYNT